MFKNVTKLNQLSRIVLTGYKSIARCDLVLGNLNVLIGPNGAGKSNFIEFFRFINQMFDQQLQVCVREAGGPDAVLHFGRNKTQELKANLHFVNGDYSFRLKPTQADRMMFAYESLRWSMKDGLHIDMGHLEARWKYIAPIMRSWRVYHFHATGRSALVKQLHSINDNEYLRDDASNMAAFLYRLKHHHYTRYNRIVKTIQMVAPFFGDFYLWPAVDNKETIELRWTEVGEDEPFGASALSDGMLRCICLTTVLLQPGELMPEIILIDEPELSLHPFAIAVLGGIMKATAQLRQLIVSTQSVELINEFDAKDLIVVDKQGGASTFKRLDANALNGWLCDYSLGELWKKNILGGRTSR